MGAKDPEKNPLDADTRMALIRSQRTLQVSGDDELRKQFLGSAENSDMRDQLAKTLIQALDRHMTVFDVSGFIQTYANSEWEEAGYDVIANENETLGLKGR